MQSVIRLLQKNIIKLHGKGIHELVEICIQRIFRLYAYAAKFLALSTIKTRYGIKITSNFDDLTFQHYVTGKYGWFYWRHIRCQEEKFIFVDIGANQGLYTVAAASNENCAHCYAFEPVAKTYDLLDRNIKLNQVHPQCSLFKKGISDRVGDVKINLATESSGGSSLCHIVDDGAQTEVIRVINGVDFWNLIDTRNVRILVKIDVEGHEQTVLEQILHDERASSIAEIFYEVDERWVDAKSIKALLLANGFTNFCQLGGGHHYDVLALRG